MNIGEQLEQVRKNYPDVYDYVMDLQKSLSNSYDRIPLLDAIDYYNEKLESSNEDIDLATLTYSSKDPLCVVYYDNGCYGCPVAIRTGDFECNNCKTYLDMSEGSLQKDISKENKIELVQKHIEFLESLVKT